MRALAVFVALVAVGGVVLAVVLADGDESESVATRSAQAEGQSPKRLTELGLTAHWPAAFQAACREMTASTSRERVPCPPVIPVGPLAVEVASPFGRSRVGQDAYSLSLASCSLNDLRGTRIDTNGCHWAYEVAWSRSGASLVVGRVVKPQAGVESSCRQVKLAGQPVSACRVPPFDQGGGFHGGHVAYLWRRSASAVTISAHGYANEPRVRAMMQALIEQAE